VAAKRRCINASDFHIGAIASALTTMMGGILLKVLAKIRPTTSNPDHDTLATLANTPNEQLDRCFASRT